MTAFNEDRAKGYDDRVRRHIPGYEILHSISETVLGAELAEDAQLLIAGIGTGTEILGWAPKHPHWRFVGVDPSEPMITIAQHKLAEAPFHDRVVLHLGTVDTLSAAEPFDAATLLLALHFLPDDGSKEALLGDLAERLKPGAPFLVATMFGDPETTRYKKLIALTKTWALAHGMDPEKAEELFDPARKDLHAVSEDRLKNLLRNAGFIDVQRLYQALTIGLWMARAPR